MAAVTISSDFGAPKNKVWHCFHCCHIYLPWSDGTRCHDLSFLKLSFKPTFPLSSFTFIKNEIINMNSWLISHTFPHSVYWDPGNHVDPYGLDCGLSEPSATKSPPQPGLRVAPQASQRPIVAPEPDAALGLGAPNRNLKTCKWSGCRPSWRRGNELKLAREACRRVCTLAGGVGTWRNAVFRLPFWLYKHSVHTSTQNVY